MKTTKKLNIRLSWRKFTYIVEDLNEKPMNVKRIHINGRFTIQGDRSFTLKPMLKESHLAYEQRGNCLFVEEEAE